MPQYLERMDDSDTNSRNALQFSIRQRSSSRKSSPISMVSSYQYRNFSRSRSFNTSYTAAVSACE